MMTACPYKKLQTLDTWSNVNAAFETSEYNRWRCVEHEKYFNAYTHWRAVRWVSESTCKNDGPEAYSPKRWRTSNRLRGFRLLCVGATRFYTNVCCRYAQVRFKVSHKPRVRRTQYKIIAKTQEHIFVARLQMLCFMAERVHCHAEARNQNGAARNGRHTSAPSAKNNMFLQPEIHLPEVFHRTLEHVGG